MHKQSVLLFLGVCAATIGCSKGSALKTYPFTGSVSYNGKNISGATVTFLSNEQNAPRTSAVTDSDGHFSISTYAGPKEVLRGAPPGDYKVTIVKQTVQSKQVGGGGGEDWAQLSPEQRQKKMDQMWQKELDTRAESASTGKPPAAEIPAKYATSETSDLSVTVVVGENEPREFKLTD